MKILFAVKALNNVAGGAERVLADISGALADKGHEVKVISFDSSVGAPFYSLNPKIERICLGIGKPLEKATISETWIRLWALRREIKDQKPDIIIPFMHSMFVITAFACIGIRIPILASEHIVPQHYKNRKLEYLLLLISTFFIEKITVLSDQVKALYPRFVRKKMVSIANPVFSGIKNAAPMGAKDSPKIILNVGRLVDQKDQKTLIKAFVSIAEKYPEWVLRIVGDGELKRDLEALIKALNIESRVILAGITANISEEYQKAHMLVLSSHYESFGLVTAEAMAHGLPCVGFQECPGTNELIINGKNGLLVDGSDERITALAQSMEILINDANKRAEFGRNARESVEPYSINHVLEKWERCIKEMVD